jgi:hypothetical protein
MDAAERLLAMLRELEDVADLRAVTSAMLPATALAAD